MLFISLQLSPEFWSLILGLILAFAASINYVKNETIKLIDIKTKLAISEIKTYITLELTKAIEAIAVLVEKNTDKINAFQMQVEHQEKYNNLIIRDLFSRIKNIEFYLQDRDGGYKIRHADNNERSTSDDILK